VLGITGIETLEIVRGVAEHVKPNLILIIDSLASRRAARISTTIQISDAGISPGSGVGNTRAGMNSETFGVPVIALGVPLVVYASTISQDTIGLIASETGLHQDEQHMKDLAEKVSEEHMDSLVVTPKDIDSIVTDMSRILADAINMALFGNSYQEVRALIA
jgi:spore protease